MNALGRPHSYLGMWSLRCHPQSEVVGVWVSVAIIIIAVLHLIASQVIGSAQACGLGPFLGDSLLPPLQSESLFELYFYKVTIVFSTSTLLLFKV